MNPPFVMFGRAHLVALALTAAVPLVLAVWARRDRRIDTTVRYGLAGILLLSWIAWYVLFAARGWLTLYNGLPLNLCDWAALALIIALLHPRQRVYELGYFWGLGGTVQGLATPDIRYDYPDAQFLFFFIEHGGIIAALLYLTLGTGMRPVWRSLPRVIAASFGYAGLAGAADWLLGTNYGFLRAKPLNMSLLDLLSPWPWYIPELVLIGTASALTYYLPFATLDWARSRRQLSIP
jgi:hypothetical integral membrane protein (TIGR02206 family)